MFQDIVLWFFAFCGVFVIPRTALRLLMTEEWLTLVAYIAFVIYIIWGVTVLEGLAIFGAYGFIRTVWTMGSMYLRGRAAAREARRERG